MRAAEPAVSVVIPTFERRRYLHRAIESVLAQSFRNFELIVADDGSTDGTEQALAAFGDRLRCHRQEHRGVAAARNAAIALSRGAIVAFLDSDDRWLPDHLAVVTDMLDRYPRAVLATTAPRSHFAGRQHPREARLVDTLPLMLVENVAGVTSCVAVRRDDLGAVGGFDERLSVGEDLALWLRLAFRGPFVLLQRRTVIKQWTAGSLIDQGSEAGDYFGAMDVLAQIGVEEARRLGRPELLTAAEGKAHFVRFLHALAEDDRGVARGSLSEACGLLPQLSREGELVAKRIERMGRNPEERLRYLATAAALWPDHHDDTALFLRARAILAALGRGRVRSALALAHAWPTGSRGFLRRSLRQWRTHCRRGLQRRIYSG